MKVIIAGSRTFDNYKMLRTLCDIVLSRKDQVEVVGGGAKGADELGRRYAKERGYKFTLFPADWDKHGKKAGPIRNGEMAEYADGLILFWDGKSRGSKNMLEQARKKGLKVRIMRFSRY